MPDLKHPLIEEAYQYAENCYAESSATVDALNQAIEVLQEETPEVQEALAQLLVEADQLIDQCGEIAEKLRQLRLKYASAHSTSGLPPETDLLIETLAGIERRRQARKQSQQ